MKIYCIYTLLSDWSQRDTLRIMRVRVWILHSKQTDSYGMSALYFKDTVLEFKPVTTRGEGGGGIWSFSSVNIFC